MLTGGLLPFPRTGCVLYAKAILSYCSEIRQVRPREVRPREGMGRLRSRTAAIRYFWGELGGRWRLRASAVNHPLLIFRRTVQRDGSRSGNPRCDRHHPETIASLTLAERLWCFFVPSPERPIEGGGLRITEQVRDLAD